MAGDPKAYTLIAVFPARGLAIRPVGTIFAHMAEQEVAKKPGWLQRLAGRWGVGVGRAVIILVVFACTGFTVMFLKRPVVAFFTAEEGGPPLLFSILYYILILPFYNVVLLAYGSLLGQFRFFWAFEKRFLNRIFGRKSERGTYTTKDTKNAKV